MGDINELGKIVAGAFAHPDSAGKGAYLPLVGDFLSFSDIITTLNQSGHPVTFKQVPRDVYAGFFPGAEALGDTLAYYEKYTYLGPGSHDAANRQDPSIAPVLLFLRAKGACEVLIISWRYDESVISEIRRFYQTVDSGFVAGAKNRQSVQGSGVVP